KLKEHASSMFGRLSPELKQYFQQYQKDFQSFSELSTKRELLLEVLKSQVILFGDYHTLSQAQRTVIRIMRDSVRVLMRKKRKVILALEMLTPEHDVAVGQFLRGKIREKEFLKRIGFAENWGFPWENYQALFDFARQHEIEIRGINPPKSARRPTLKTRDQFAAKIIADISIQDPKAIVFVLIGDLHLAGPHLPLELRNVLKKRKVHRQTLIVHQNLEKLYWQLVEQGLENFVDVVRIKRNVFCVMNTPPWVKLKSHLNWTELIAETGSIPPLETAAQAFHEMDYSHEVEDLTQMIGKFLGMTLPKLDNFQIYGPLDLELIEKDNLGPSSTKSPVAAWNARYAKVFKSYFIPGSNIIFLNSLSLNHVAAQSSIYLYYHLSGFQDVFENPKRDFYRFIWIEALGFLGAKIINPKRKCNGRLDLRKHLSKLKNETLDENNLSAKLALEHLEWERDFAAGNAQIRFMFPTSPKKNLLYYKAAKVLGHLLGHALYHSIVEMRVSPSEVRSIFYHNFHSSEDAYQLYSAWIRRLDVFNYRDSVKWERL
ncbi:MAG: ChaN family lipoprotein, partial [Deltaproteobacteria bacterium]